ncbi:ADP-ribosylation factor-like protein 2, variant 2 [Trifolium repens]|nr:ADP-ribosylation factor-like protein 2, variant 2 [Trifolium repens]
MYIPSAKKHITLPCGRPFFINPPSWVSPPPSSELRRLFFTVAGIQRSATIVPFSASIFYRVLTFSLGMGLLSIIRKIKKKEKEMRILMVGLDNSGKTTIVLKINGEDTSVISPTLGFNIKTITYQKYTLNIWDVGGQKTIRSYWRNYFEQTDGLVWVVDSSDLRRLDDCKMELDNLLKEERLSGSSLLILANKQDIKGALAPAEIAKVLNLEAMDKSRHWMIVGCSAYTGEGLLEGFDWLVQDIASRIYMLD